MNNNTINFPQIELIEERAGQWLAAMDRELCTQEQEQLESWLQESPQHAEIFLELAVFWDKADALSVISRVMPISDLIPVGEERSSQKKARKPLRIYGFTGLAACFVFAIMMTTFFMQGMFDNSHVYFEETYHTSLGEQKTVLLPDGTEVTLNTDSQVIARYSKKTRSIMLVRGEAYFEVAKDPSTPFVASIDQATVTAVGTAFNIQKIVAGYQVLVTEGVVKVSSSDTKKPNHSMAMNTETEYRMIEGQQLLVQNQSTSKIKVVDIETIDAELAWREGMLLFRGETLQQVISEINRYSVIQLVIEDESIESITVGGLFKADDTEQILSILEYNFDLVSRRVADKLFLSRKEPIAPTH